MTELAELRRTTAQLSRRFAIANAVPFAAMLLLACTAGGLLSTEILGNLNLGMLLSLAQGAVLLMTARWFTHRLAQVPCRASGQRRT